MGKKRLREKSNRTTGEKSEVKKMKIEFVSDDPFYQESSSSSDSSSESDSSEISNDRKHKKCKKKGI